MLERKVFQKIMMKSGRKEREENVKFLSTVSILKDLESEKLNKISDLLKRVNTIPVESRKLHCVTYLLHTFRSFMQQAPSSFDKGIRAINFTLSVVAV
jgi:hypothetical protein